jgi:hypothetical protein
VDLGQESSSELWVDQMHLGRISNRHSSRTKWALKILVYPKVYFMTKEVQTSLQHGVHQMYKVMIMHQINTTSRLISNSLQYGAAYSTLSRTCSAWKHHNQLRNHLLIWIRDSNLWRVALKLDTVYTEAFLVLMLDLHREVLWVGALCYRMHS